MVLAPNPSTTGTAVPQGNGYATIAVNSNGAASVAGRLSDGTPYSTSGYVAGDGTLAVYSVPSGSPSGSSLNGLLTFRATAVSDLDGTLAWTQSSKATDCLYPAGFATQLPTVGSRYVRPITGLEAMDAPPGAATAGFGNGSLSEPLNVPVTVNGTGQVVMVTPGIPDVTLRINSNSGMVTGSFVLPGSNVTTTVRGVVFQKQQSAYGYFRGVNQYGYFALVPSS